MATGLNSSKAAKRRARNATRGNSVKLGLCTMNIGPLSEPEGLTATARLAEDAGFESLWVGDHAILSDPPLPQMPMPAQVPILDILIALTWVASTTKKIRLGTGIIVLPQRNPIVLAKQISSIDVLSGGRMTVGLGVGWLEPEFKAIGVSFANRGALMDDYLAALEHLWYDDHPEYHGRFVDFSRVDAYPRPVQIPIPLIIGGQTPAAYRRAVASGHGWYGFGLSPEALAGCLNGLRRVATTSIARQSSAASRSP